jgi:signal transduction histidine kinase
MNNVLPPPDGKELISQIAHELNTPLTTVLGNAHHLLSVPEDAEGEEGRRALEDIELSAERLSRTLQNLLLLVRLELDLKPFDQPLLLRQVLQTIARTRPRSWGERKLDLKLNLQGATVAAGYDHLRIALTNLLDNAFLYSPPDTTVTIEGCLEDSRVILEVYDRAATIAEGDRESIFQPFFRSVALTETHPGLGLGLPVSRRLIELYGGALTVRARPGGGNVFRVSLPLLPVEAEE